MTATGWSHHTFTLLFALQMRSGDEQERSRLHMHFAGTQQNLIAFCVLSTRHCLEKLGESCHSLEAGEKGQRGQFLTPSVSVLGHSAIPFFISWLQPGGHRDTTPAQSIPGSRAQSKLPQYLVTSGCTLSCPTDSSSRCRGPPRRCCPPPAPSSSSPPCTACSSAGPNSSSCSPCLPSPDTPRSPWPPGLVVMAAARGNRLIFREAHSLPR